jgi:hypothetical protein
VGSHVWTDQCPCCAFEKMNVSTYDSLHFDVTCQICGYKRWTEERIPPRHDIYLAKQLLRNMDHSGKERAIIQHSEDGIPLVIRSRETSS